MGKIYVVGIGPGGKEDMTFRAYNAIMASDIVVGYTCYVDLIKDIIGDKEVFSTPMRGEAERCKRAAELALEGKTVALVSSGDSGVYGMASIMYAVCEPYPQTEIEVVSGVTACCSGAALLGAPIGHDFALVSLSDLLTPWEVIEKRLLLASQADFVICLYNPSSKKRADYLRRACDIMLRCKSEQTACGYVKNISREGETHGVMSLSELADFKADMFTTVFVGNSQTRIVGGRLVTPRGYVL